MRRPADRELAPFLANAPVESGRLRFAAGARAAASADYVLVWMQKAQRARDNPALDLGFHLANGLKLPLLVLFVLTEYPGAKAPHYRFMLSGLRECADDLRQRGAAFVLERGAMAATVAGYARRAAVLVADEGKLTFEREWRERIAAAIRSGRAGDPPLVIVETESVVPPDAASMARFGEFLEDGLARYGEARNDPLSRGQSDMSPYLHFGQVSPVSLVWRALERSESAAQPYVEQLVVRRELAINFTLHCPGYGRYETAVPDWARASLADRAGLSTPYSIADLEAGHTEDPYWNAAQKEMILTGKMHNYMRMYWGKRLLAWFENPAEAFQAAVALNDTYSLDGRDPNGYAGVAWCFGRHDRPWPQRQGFGSVRAMMASGLRKKFDADRYASEIEALYTQRTKETP